MIARIGEAAAVTFAGGALAGVTWSLVGLGWPAAVVGGLNGLVSGWRGTYGWRTGRGVMAMALDSTWAAPMTVSALVAHVAALFAPARGGYVRVLSERQDRHVYAGGLRLRRRFVIALGNTVNNAGPDVATSVRRRRLVLDHEDLHVWQARWFGPLYPLAYVGWMVVMGPVGAVVWLLRRPRRAALFSVAETFAYYMNPFEWWAYSREGKWPPAGMVRGLGWRRPMVRPVNREPAAPPAAPG
ncbi:MAG: hypothetical protein ACRDZ2_16895 [Ilumatobacteraceae bacterium]